MPKARTAVRTPDFEQVAQMSKSEIQSAIVGLGADYHAAESKADLGARLLQLQGVAQPSDKLKKQLNEHGMQDDNSQAVPSIKKINKRLTVEEMTKAAKKYIDKGMKLLISKDGTIWEIRFECPVLRQDGKIVTGKRKDSGNTLIPLFIFQRACETITTYQKIKSKQDADAIPPDYEEVDGAGEAA